MFSEQYKVYVDMVALVVPILSPQPLTCFTTNHPTFSFNKTFPFAGSGHYIHHHHLMADPVSRNQTNWGEGEVGNKLKYSFDAGFISGTQPPDSPTPVGGNYSGDAEISESSDSESCYLVGNTKRMGDLAATFRVFSESLVRMELAELEMIKAREALRLKAEKRQVKVEAEMTQMLLQTQLQIATFLSKKSTNRKRKRVGEDESSTSEREAALMLSFMQCNLML